MNYRLVRPAPAADSSESVGPGLRADPQQQAVIAHTAGPLLVVGGAGTGKTTTLVESVAARVASGVSPDRVLVLTFGRRSAGLLRDRIERRIAHAGQATAEPLVRTFHAYAFGLLRLAAAQQGEPPPRLLTGPEQDLVIREMLAGDAAHWPESLRPALGTRAFTGQLRDLLLRCAERGVGARQLADLGGSTGRPEWLAAARFMREYEQVMALRDATGRAGVAYDSAELVRAAAALLHDEPELLAAQRRRLAHVYVDELADTDPAQVELLRLIAGGGAALVAFADPDSSTYAFRGADPDVVRHFPELFPTAAGTPAPTALLTTSHRAGGELLTAAARVAPRQRGGAPRRQTYPLPDAEPGVVEVHTFRAAASEANYLAHRLREAHLRDGVPWHRMAVILRSTTLALASLQRALAQAGVPTTTHADDLPLRDQPGVAPLLLALRCALDPSRLDEEAAVALLHSPLGGADPLSERRLRQGLRAIALAGGDRRPSGLLLVEALLEPAELIAIDRRWARPAQAVARLLATVREAAGLAGTAPSAAPVASGAAAGASAEQVLWALWQASGLAERWAAASSRGGYRGAAADRDLDAILVLFDAAARFVDRLPGARVEVFLEHVEGQQLPADTLARTADRGSAVRLLTAHAAKGQEWDVVAVAGVQEGVWPDLRLRGSVLGAEQLVDLVSGRAIPSPVPATDTAPVLVGGVPQPRTGSELVRAVSQTAALLAEERRLFSVAVTRARQRLIVTAVHSGDGEEQPSRFLYELEGGDAATREPVATRLPRALTLPALVAELRVAVADAATPPDRRRAAAAHLARLAASGVPGADPDQWWGLNPLSDDRPLVDADGVVTVSPSTVESVQRCSLRWLLERHGGSKYAQPGAERWRPGTRDRPAGHRSGRPGRTGRLPGRRVRQDRTLRALAGRAAAPPRRADDRQAGLLAGRQPAPAGRDRAGLRGTPGRRDPGQGPGGPARSRRPGSAGGDRPEDRPRLAHRRRAARISPTRRLPGSGRGGRVPGGGAGAGRRVAGTARYRPCRGEGAEPAAAVRVGRSDLGGGTGTQDSGGDGGFYVQRCGQLALPQLSGTPLLPGQRQGPATTRGRRGRMISVESLRVDA